MQKGRRKFLKAVGGTSVGSLVGAHTVGTARAQESKLVSQSKRHEIAASLLNLYRGIPDKKPERLRDIWQISGETISAKQEMLEVLPDLKTITRGSTIGTSVLGVLKNILGNIEKAYNVTISTQYIDLVSRGLRYIPLLSQVYNFVDVCTEIRNLAEQKENFLKTVKSSAKARKKVERFYIAILLIIAEIILLVSGVGYPFAFRNTRKVANLGLVRVRSAVGMRVYSILLSVVHWLIRGGVEGTISYVVNKSGEVVESVDSIEGVKRSYAEGLRSVSKSEVYQSLLKHISGVNTSITIPSQIVSWSGDFTLHPQYLDGLLALYGAEEGIVAPHSTSKTDGSGGFF